MSAEEAISLRVTRHKGFSPGRVSAICRNTLLELTRLKVFYILLLFALAIIGASLLWVDLTFQEEFQMLKTAALGAMSIFTWLLAVLPTSLLLPKDAEDRTLYTILAKPVGRFEYLLGKLLGVLIMIAISTVLMSALMHLVLYVHEQSRIADEIRHGTDPAFARQAIHAAAFTPNLLPGIVLIIIKAALCAALTLFISTFSSSWIFTVFISVCVYAIGNVEAIAREAWQQQHLTEALPALQSIFLGVVTIFAPDLQLFSVVDDLAAGTVIPLRLFFECSGLGVAYCCGYLFAAYLMFAWKEL